MPYIRKLSNGKYPAEISKNYNSIQSKTFPKQKSAEKWAEGIEKNIDTILSLKPKKLRKLSPEKVEELGGLSLFQKLGVDVDFLTFDSLVNDSISMPTGHGIVVTP